MKTGWWQRQSRDGIGLPAFETHRNIVATCAQHVLFPGIAKGRGCQRQFGNACRDSRKLGGCGQRFAGARLRRRERAREGRKLFVAQIFKGESDPAESKMVQKKKWRW